MTLSKGDLIDGAVMLENLAATLREEVARLAGEGCDELGRLRITTIRAQIRLAERLTADLLLRARRNQ